MKETYFNFAQTVKKQEQTLGTVLMEKLPNSEVGGPLFEYLLARRELLKERIVKEPSLELIGRANELKDLLTLFKQKRDSS